NEQRTYNRIQREVGIRKRFTDPNPEGLKKNKFDLVPSREGENGRGQKARKPRSRRGRSRNSRRVRDRKSSDTEKNKPHRNKKKRRRGRGPKKRKADARP
ncbi:MAG: hypothetical protein VX708_05470, partial [Candidatus Thermoplasmatota archaeon]|nr:hypothetical protein [Candidatus Thermoplasmatota archaeon]